MSVFEPGSPGVSDLLVNCQFLLETMAQTTLEGEEGGRQGRGEGGVAGHLGRVLGQRQELRRVREEVSEDGEGLVPHPLV